MGGASSIPERGHVMRSSLLQMPTTRRRQRSSGVDKSRNLLRPSPSPRFEGIVEHPFGLFTCEWCGELLTPFCPPTSDGLVDQTVLSHITSAKHMDRVRDVKMELPKVTSKGVFAISGSAECFSRGTQIFTPGERDLFGFYLSESHVKALVTNFGGPWELPRLDPRVAAELRAAEVAKRAAMNSAANSCSPRTKATDQQAEDIVPLSILLQDVVGVILASVFASPHAALHVLDCRCDNRWTVRLVPSIFCIEVITRNRPSGCIMLVSVRCRNDFALSDLTKDWPRVVNRAVERLKLVVLCLLAMTPDDLEGLTCTEKGIDLDEQRSSSPFVDWDLFTC